MTSRETILIIDDDAVLRRSLRALLEGLGLSVAEAGSGVEGLAAALREAPAMVLLDLTMPGMNGFDVCEGLRALPGHEGMPVIVMSGLLGTSQKVRAFHAGAVDSLAKPLQPEEVEVRVKTHLAIRRQRIELLEGRDNLRKTLSDTDALNRNLITLNEKLRHSEEVKTRFLALMRNEINNPLNDIMGLADRIADPGVPAEKARELAAMVKGEAFRLDCQIRNVFTAAELEAGEASPFMARVDVASVVRDVMASFQPAAVAKGVSLTSRLAGETAAYPGDGDKVHHILANLLANAVEWSGPGGTVELLAEGAPESLVLQVLDHGPGLGEKNLKALLEPFATAGFKSHHGQGLGLPVVKALADLLGGELRVATVPGGGAAFQVTLPRAPAQAEVEAEALDGNVLIFDEPREF